MSDPKDGFKKVSGIPVETIVQDYLTANPSSGGTWGSITGTLSTQTDLQNALNALIPKPASPTTGYYLKWDGSNWVAAAVAAGGGGGTKVWKTATETLTANTTLQDDDELTFTVLANKTYRIKLNISYYDGSGNAIKAMLKVPSFADPQNGRTDEDNMLLSNGGTLKVGKFTASAATVTGLSINSASGEYILHVGSTAGQVVLKWAQSVASGTGKVYAGSFIEYEQLD